MALDSINGNIGRRVLAKRVYVKRPQYRYGQWHLHEFEPDENDPREVCGSAGQIRLALTDEIAAVEFIDPRSHQTTMLFAHMDDLEESDAKYTAPAVNTCWVGGGATESEAVMDYVRRLEQRIIALEEMFKPRLRASDGKTVDFLEWVNSRMAQTTNEALLEALDA